MEGQSLGGVEAWRVLVFSRCTLPFQPGHFLPANRKPNRTEPHRTEISVCSVFCCRFGLWFCTVRCSASALVYNSNRTEEPNKPKCMLQTRKLETPPSPHALSPSRPIVPRPIKTQRKPPWPHPVAQRAEAAPQPLIPLSRTLAIPFPNPKSSSGGRRATEAGHGEPTRRREAGGGRLRAQS